MNTQRIIRRTVLIKLRWYRIAAPQRNLYEGLEEKCLMVSCRKIFAGVGIAISCCVQLLQQWRWVLVR